MTQDLLTNNKLYIQKEDGDFVELKAGKLELPKQDEYYTYCDTPFINLSPETSFDIKMKKKAWYRVQKALWLIKPIYKKKRKGNRYVWYEVI
jgi:hypothetical protein